MSRTSAREGGGSSSRAIHFCSLDSSPPPCLRNSAAALGVQGRFFRFFLGWQTARFVGCVGCRDSGTLASMDVEERRGPAELLAKIQLPKCFVVKNRLGEKKSRGSSASVGGRRRGRPLILRPAKLLASLSSAAGIKQGVAMSERKEKGRKVRQTPKAKKSGARSKDRDQGEHSKVLATIASIPKPAYFFAAGAISGAIGKTVTAPLDRVKVLLQVKGGYSGSLVTQAAKNGGFFPAMRAIFREEGLASFWKGNVPQVLRVLPYSALNLYGYEKFKEALDCKEGEKWMVAKRLVAGAAAGMLATVVTYPLDTVRLRMAVDSSIRTMPQAMRLLSKEGGMVAFYRGVGPAMIGVAPYMALELASFDFLKKVLATEDLKGNPGISFVSGFVAALMASSVTYPLDTVRRQIQLQGGSMMTLPNLFKGIVANEGAQGLYRGFVPSCLKNLPNKGIRLATFDAAKNAMAAAEEQEGKGS